MFLDNEHTLQNLFEVHCELFNKHVHTMFQNWLMLSSDVIVSCLPPERNLGFKILISCRIFCTFDSFMLQINMILLIWSWIVSLLLLDLSLFTLRQVKNIYSTSYCVEIRVLTQLQWQIVFAMTVSGNFLVYILTSHKKFDFKMSLAWEEAKE